MSTGFHQGFAAFKELIAKKDHLTGLLRTYQRVDRKIDKQLRARVGGKRSKKRRRQFIALGVGGSGIALGLALAFSAIKKQSAPAHDTPLMDSAEPPAHNTPLRDSAEPLADDSGKTNNTGSKPADKSRAEQPFGMLSNVNNSCYLNSLLMCLFIRNHSFVAERILHKKIELLRLGYKCSSPDVALVDIPETLTLIKQELLMPTAVEQLTQLINSKASADRKGAAKEKLNQMKSKPLFEKLAAFYSDYDEKVRSEDDLRTEIKDPRMLVFVLAYEAWVYAHSQILNNPKDFYKQELILLSFLKRLAVIKSSDQEPIVEPLVNSILAEVKRKQSVHVDSKFERERRAAIQRELQTISAHIQKGGTMQSNDLRTTFESCYPLKKFSCGTQESSSEAIQALLQLFEVYTTGDITPIVMFEVDNQVNIEDIMEQASKLIQAGNNLVDTTKIYDSDLLVFARERSGDPAQLLLPKSFQLGTRTLHLRGIVVHRKNNNHYVCYVQHKDTWYFVNDMGPYSEEIGTFDNLLDYSKTYDPWRNGTLFFYFT